jgi:hypothetical protein
VKNKMEDLRNHLFVTLEALLDKEKPLDIERAHAVAKTAQVMVNAAKVEVDYLKVTGGNKGSGFMQETPRLTAPEIPKLRRLK